MQIMSPFTIGDQKLKNRLVMAPLTRGRCTPSKKINDPISRLPNKLMAEHYAQRAGAGLILSEATAISSQGYGWKNAPGCYNDDQMKAWKTVVDAVHAKKGLIYLQLWHTGRQSHSTFHECKEIVSASAVAVGSGQATTAEGKKTEYETPRALTIEEIKATVQDYKKCAALAKKAGFDGVEIHSANGYLIDQFFQSCSNKRTDAYGGSMENRVRFFCEIVEAVKEVYDSKQIGFRLSPNGSFGGMGSEDNDKMFPFIAKTAEKYNLAYLHLMDGLGFGYHNKAPVVTCADIRKVFFGPIIANCGLTRDIAEGIIRSGAADLACFGRLYISNPDLADRFANDYPVAPEADYSTWWMPTGAKGYTDFPTYAESKQK